jgi:hypothetical protein
MEAAEGIAESFLQENAYLTEYLTEGQFGHCSWIGGIVYHCPRIEIEGASTLENPEPRITPPDPSVISPTPVPEPGSLVMGAGGAAMLLLARVWARRRKPLSRRAERSRDSSCFSLFIRPE